MSSTSCTVSSGTVLMETRPVLLTVIASLAAAALSGMSHTQYASTSPKAKWNDSIDPPTPFATSDAAARRADPPSFSTPSMPSFEYRTFNRYFGMSAPSIWLRAPRAGCDPPQGLESMNDLPGGAVEHGQRRPARDRGHRRPARSRAGRRVGVERRQGRA